MHCLHPFETIEFEVPDEWLTTAGANAFVPSHTSFVALSEPSWPTVLVSVEEVEAPRRDPGFVGLNEQRAISVLQAMVANKPLPPIEVHRKPSVPTNRLSVRDGYHRYFLSIALAFTMLPVSVRPYFNINAL